MQGHLQLNLGLLGRFQASAATSMAEAIQISSRRSRGLLAYLAMAPDYAESRERLADLFWGEREERHARQSLRQCLLVLRRELAAGGCHALEVERDTIALTSPVAVDAREFLALCASPAPADMARAAELYRGMFLANVSIESEAFSEWVVRERARVEAAALSLLERYAVHLDELGEGEEAVRVADRLAHIDPLREASQRLRLRLHVRYRGRDAALALAVAITKRLHSEFDAAPEAETAALIEAIRRGTAAAPNGRADPAAPALALVAAPEVTAPAPAPASPGQPAPAPPLSESSPPVESSQTVPMRAATQGPRRALAAAGLTLAVLASAGALLVLRPAPPARDAAPDAKRAAADRAWSPPSILGSAGPVAPGIHAIAVLPFTTEGEDKSDQARAARITGDLINDLSRIPSLRVISRQTTRLYQGRAVDVAAVGTELGVSYVVEGSVHREGTTLRVNVALTETQSRVQVWSDRIEADLNDSFAAQNALVRGIARRLQVGHLVLEDLRRRPGQTVSPDVRDLVARGWGAMLAIGDIGKAGGAQHYFEEALKREPANASARLGLAAYNASVVAMFLVPEPEPYLSRAESALDRLIGEQVDASLPYYFRGIVHKARGRPQAALDDFRRLLELNPSFAPGYAQVGHVLSRIGRIDEAMDHVRYAIRLSPKDPLLALWSLFGGEILLEGGRDEEAMEWLMRAASLNPRSPFIRASLAAAHALRGDTSQAAALAAEVRVLAPWLSAERMIARLQGLSTAGSEPRRLIEGLQRAFSTDRGDAGTGKFQ